MDADELVLVESLYDARRIGQPVVPLRRSLDLGRALQLQLAVADRFGDAGATIGGWKVGLTSGSSKDLLGADFRPFGYVLADRIFASGGSIPWQSVLECAIQPELCLLLGSPLRGNVTPEEAKRAVGGIAAAFELTERRVAAGQGANGSTLVADGLAQWGIVVGPPAPVSAYRPNLAVELRCDETTVARVQAGDDFEIDDPFVSLSRLSALLGEHGRSLDVGQAVITGAFVHAPVRGPSRWHATFAGVGEVAISFTSTGGQDAVLR